MSLKFDAIRVRAHVCKGKATGKWFIDVPASLTSTGKRKRRLYQNRRQAVTLARELSRKLRMKALGYVDNTARSCLLLRDGVELWKEAQQMRVRTYKLRWSSLAVNLFRLKPVVAFLGTYDIATVKSEDLERYQMKRLAEGCAPATINSEVATLRQVLKWLAERNYRNTVPNVQRVKSARRRADIPTLEEMARLISLLPSRLRTLVRLLAETGMRPGEAYNLPWTSVVDHECNLVIQPHDAWQPKTESSVRTIPVCPSLMAEIRQLPRKGFYVFPGRKPGKPIDNFRKALATAVRKAGLSRNNLPMRITAKTFRKAFATWQAKRQVHPGILQSMMGHVPGSRVTEQFYIFGDEAAKRSAILELPSLEPGESRA